MELMPHQVNAVGELKNGNILFGGVGSGKSIAILSYYMEKICTHEFPPDIYVITTAKKRDSLDWEKEAAHFGISTDVFLEDDRYKKYRGVLTIDSWNNMSKYEDVEGAYFVFDEQRLVGTGAWTKSFLKIAKKNQWNMLSATPGDTWMDYMPVFIANGFYKNKTDFLRQHVIYEPFLSFPKIKAYFNQPRLEFLRNEILVEMPYARHTERFINYFDCGYDENLVKMIQEKRWNPYTDEPIKDAAEMARLAKRVVRSDPSRLEMVRKWMTCHDRLIIYYNFNYELDILRTLRDSIPVYEWNGHQKDDHRAFEHQPKWCYLVQYVAGAEAWNCTTTDAMVLYSLTYSYKNFEQSMGRIDRLDTPFTILYYYVLMSNLWVDVAVKESLSNKKSFNERDYVMKNGLWMPE